MTALARRETWDDGAGEAERHGVRALVRRETWGDDAGEERDMG